MIEIGNMKNNEKKISNLIQIFNAIQKIDDLLFDSN